MATLLYEIGTEEMPAQYMPGILKNYKELAETKLKEARIPFEKVSVYGTPRRMAFVAEGIADRQEDMTAESKGPSLKIAFDADGNPTKAVQGFARGQGVEVSALEKRDGYVYAIKHTKGGETKVLLPALLDDILHSLSFPKTMRWADYDFGFVRPFHWMVALIDSEVIPVEANDVKSGNVTRGHRFLGSQTITIPSAEAYVKTLEENFIIVDVEKRRALIREQIEALGKKAGGHTAISEDLLDEVTYLVEYPTALCGSIDDKYLKLPKEAVITPMRDHQRYFPVLDDSGKLLPYFITVRNGNSEHLDIVTHGNERVLRARLDDAVFFFENDRKKSLEAHREALHDVAFQRGMGNMYEKTERLEALTSCLLKESGVAADEKALVRAARLSKADLVTGMVTEFTELQGTMGREYALLDGEGDTVSTAIGEQYMPRFAGDELPQTNEGRLLAIADKLDNITATFSRGEAPTGSQDPYALRRQALGILNIVTDGNIHFALTSAIKETLSRLPKTNQSEDKLVADIVEFFAQRSKNMMLDRGVRYDIVDAVLGAEGRDDLCDAFAAADALTAYLGTDKAPETLQAFTRVENITKKSRVDAPVSEALLREDAEKALFEAVEKAAENVHGMLLSRDFAGVLTACDSLSAPINHFFDDVMVMDKDEAVKQNRLALLTKIRSLIGCVGDVSLLVMK